MEDADDLIRILSMLKNKADSAMTTATYTWQELSQMTRNVTGQTVDYDSFKIDFDSNPELKNLVNRFDGDVVELKTKVKPDEVTGQEPNADINASAKRAAAKTLQQPG